MGVDIVNGDVEASEGGDVTQTELYVVQDEVLVVEPHVGMQFETVSSAKTFYDEYAKREGFGVTIFHTGPLRPDNSSMCRQFVCSKRRSNDVCGAMMRVDLKGNKWVVTKFIKEHNHTLENPKSQHTTLMKNFVESYEGSIMIPSGVMYVTMDGNDPSQSSMKVNRVAKTQIKGSKCVDYATRPVNPKRKWGKDAQNMLDYFKKMQAENPGFFYAIQLDEDNHMTNIFWADQRSRSAYSHFGDVVTLDTSYRVTHYEVLFASFTGVNHHGQTILFGCGLLLDDSEPSFVWLLRAFLTSMSDLSPVSIVTDQDSAIQGAVNRVLPNARHCINKWHILREGQEKLAHICLSNSNFQVELYNCINLTDTIEEFESSWALIIDKYDLKNNDWLQSLYDARKKWVPVYFRDSFFASISPNQGVECSFFDGYVNQNTTLPLFFRQYERAMEYWFEKEIEADFDTVSNTSVLRTPSPMEKQAAELYTKNIFVKFQDELVETFAYTATRIDGDGITSTYRVAKFEDDHRSYKVNLNKSDMRASCSCLMFEYSGILCRHILTVFTVTNVLTLPSHFILRRWTRNAKCLVMLDESCVDLDHVPESIPLRYNSLSREAIRYAEEGSTSSETFITALTGLREEGKKVASMRTNIVKATPQVFASGYDDKKTSAVDTPLLWPRQDETSRRFNLSDKGIRPQPVSDMDLLYMGPTSLQRDDTYGNSGLLPCLKSMTWVMENKYSTPANRVAVINLKLQDYNKNPAVESEVKFQLSRLTLEPMLKSMAHISEQLSTSANRVAIINLKHQDSETISGESEVKFQVSRDTLGAMLRSMAYIREQLSLVVDLQPSKKHRK